MKSSPIKKNPGKKNKFGKQWMREHVSDPFVQLAQKEGYRSRAAFKLLELDDKFGFLKPGIRVVDLGAAPGGWTQVAAKRVQPGAGPRGGRVIAVDILAMEPVEGAEVLTLDMLAPDAPDRVAALLGGQAELLRSLEERRSRRVGGGRDSTGNVRIVASTNRDLEAAVRDGGFRRDLFFRLNVIPIVIPPLRERPEDVPPLAEYFLAKMTTALRRPARTKAAPVNPPSGRLEKTNGGARSPPCWFYPECSGGQA